MPKHLITIPSGAGLPTDVSGLPEGYPFYNDTDGSFNVLKAGAFVPAGGGGGGGGALLPDLGMYLEADNVALPAAGGNVTVSWETWNPTGGSSTDPRPSWWLESPDVPPKTVISLEPGWYQLSFYFWLWTAASSNTILQLHGIGATQEWFDEVANINASGTGPRTAKVASVTPPLHFNSSMSLNISPAVGGSDTIEVDCQIVKLA